MRGSGSEGGLAKADRKERGGEVGEKADGREVNGEGGWFSRRISLFLRCLDERHGTLA